MISAVLLVNWDDVRDTAPTTQPPLNPALVAQALLKKAGLRAHVSEAHVYGDWSVEAAPARISSGPSVWVTACCWTGLRLSRSMVRCSGVQTCRRSGLAFLNAWRGTREAGRARREKSGGIMAAGREQ